MKKTKIVCTIGPASEDPQILVQLIDAGMNVARLNFSHGNHEEHRERIKNIRAAAKKAGRNIGILLDTRGPEIRTHNMQDGSVELVEGTAVSISMKEVMGTAERFSVTYSGLIHDIDVGATILLDDGLIELEVVEIDYDEEEIITKVINSGTLQNKKSVNIPGVSINLPGMTEKDAEDILFGIEEGVDFIAASFVRRASDVLEIRKLLEENGAPNMNIIPKIENQEGVDKIDEILEVSDGLMVARGDLGVEIPAETVPLVQKQLIKKCNEVGKPVITATQMLDSMQRNPRPTRAEASDVANAIFDGSDAIMLSGETAAGAYPVAAVQTMNNIALTAEKAMDYKDNLFQLSKKIEHNMMDTICYSVAHTAMKLGVSAIVAPTESGHTAKMISKYRPQAPIIAITPSEEVVRRLTLVWGVQPKLGQPVTTTDEMLEHSVTESINTGLVKHGDRIIITAGIPVGEQGTTNLMKVHVVGDVLAKGQGIGRKSAYGKAVILKDSKEKLGEVSPGSIIISTGTDRDMVSILEQSAGLITEEGGITSHAAVVGISLGIPVVVGVENATKLIKDGQEITVDANHGVIYNGHAGVL